MKKLVITLGVACVLIGAWGIFYYERTHGTQSFSGAGGENLTTEGTEGTEGESSISNIQQGISNVQSTVYTPHSTVCRPQSTVHPPLDSSLYALGSSLSFERDGKFGTPRFVGKRSGLLSPAAPGASVEDVLKAFLDANGRAFTLHESDVLGAGNAEKVRDVVTKHSGMRSVTWQQQKDGIDIVGAQLALNLDRENRIVNIQSTALHLESVRFVENAEVTADEAVAIAGESFNRRWAQMNADGELGSGLATKNTAVRSTTGWHATTATNGVNGNRHKNGNAGDDARPLIAVLRSPASIWYPLDMCSAVKALELIVEYGAETHRLIIRADTGEVVEDLNLTWGLEDVTYSVYTNDSPSPFSPGMNEPTNYVPSEVTQSVVTVTALDTNASPLGWIPDGGNETAGNNVDAYDDSLDDDTVDAGDRVDASPLYRDFTVGGAITSGVVQAFYWGNVFHDRMYQLGFDEAAGNFQEDNLGRGGRDADRMKIEVWNGAFVTPYGQFSQANMTVLNDGSRPRMQLYLWNRNADEFFNPLSPGMRDSALDAEVIFHEATHGVSSRLIGDGYGLSTVQSRGMAEGWSDFMAMSLLSEEDDDHHGVYAFGAYVAAWQSWSNNYYHGIRRFPYTTDMNKAPQTFADSDPNQIYFDPAIPINPKWAKNDEADQIHRVGEIWCLALWESRANLIEKYGFAGNEMLMQLVVDGMKLTPVDPTFTEARDAIFQADIVGNGGTNQLALWRGFAKRGLGFSATVPESHSTVGIREEFDLPFGVSVEVTEVGGDGDGYVEPGESGEMVVTVESYEMGLTGVTGVLEFEQKETKGTKDVLVTHSNAVFGEIVIGGNSTSAPPFEFSVSTNFVGNSNAWFVLRVESDKGWFEESFGVLIGNPYDYPPEIYGIAATNITETNAWVSWSTGIPADGLVEYGVTTSYGMSSTLDPVMRTNHLAELPNLTKGTEYHFRILSEGTNGLTGISGDHTFRTATQIYVNVNSTATQELGTVTAPFKTLQAAANAARATSDEILVAWGTYTGTDSEGVLVMSGSDWNLTVLGGHSDDFTIRNPDMFVTVINGEKQRRGILIDYGATLLINGITITDGESEWGGGVSVRRSTFSADNCIFIGNASTNGINTAGGALHSSLGALIYFSHCLVKGNYATWGGGIYGTSGDTVLTLSQCALVANVGITGGGLKLEGYAKAVVNNCLFSENSAEYDGGGLSVAPHCSVIIQSSTFASNIVWDAFHSEYEGGGGISVAGVISSASLSLLNTVVYNNKSSFGNDLNCNEHSEVHVTHSCIGDIYGNLTSSNHLICTDPKFADPVAGDFHLLYGSPCIDSGAPEYSGNATDMDGEPRPFGAAIDMGVDEFTDADGDDMADYWEVREYGDILTTEGTEDTDGDALNTFGEYMEQTDPHDGDTDGDSMPDGWEVDNSLDAKSDDAGLDVDGDTMNNADEYAADTDPQDAGSLLRMNQVCSDMGGVRIEWQGGVEAAQWLESCGRLTDGWRAIFGVPPPTPTNNAVIVFDSIPTQFYRIRVERE